MAEERGSTLPLILGFAIVALLLVAGSVVAGQAFVQQRDLQDVCDGAAVAAAGSAADLDRATGAASTRSLRFAAVQTAVQRYLGRDPGRPDVTVRAELSPDAETIVLSCSQVRPVAFGAAFGHAGGVRHIARSAARAPLT